MERKLQKSVCRGQARKLETKQANLVHGTPPTPHRSSPHAPQLLPTPTHLEGRSNWGHGCGWEMGLPGAAETEVTVQREHLMFSDVLSVRPLGHGV